MKNSASNSSQIQALKIQAEQLLPLITKALSKQGYQNIAHQRISQQNESTNIDTDIETNIDAKIDIRVYQGLTRATYNNFGQVMIKWEISANILYDLTSLAYEIKVIKALNSFEIRSQASINIAPQLLTDNYLLIKIADKNYQLTLLVMPYFEQGSFAKYLKQPLTDEQKQQLIIKAANLIANLHQSGWIHRDIKPSNILIHSDTFTNRVDDSCCLLLTDFALAEPIDNDNKHKVNDNQSAGTPAYLAPEMWQGQGATRQSDIYAFGVMLYEILMDERPYAIESSSSEPFGDWAIQHCQQPIPMLLSQYNKYQLIMEKCLAKRSKERYLIMESVLNDLISID